MAAENIEQISPEECETFESDIQLYLRLFCEENKIEDMRTASQSVWNACLYYIYKHVFKNGYILKDNTIIDNPNSNIKSTYNRYNIDMCMKVLDIYIYDMCMVYDKEVSVIGYSTLTGINTQTIYDWRESDERLGGTGIDIFQKLTRFREESLSNKLVTGAKNPVGVIAVLNRQFGWASPYTSDANRQKQPLTAAQLPRLDTQPQDIAQIEAKPQDIVIDSVKTECT